MVLIDDAPLFYRIRPTVILLVNEIASISEAAEPFFGKRMATLRFIRAIGFHVNAQLLRTVGELALAAVRTVPFLSEIFAERAFSLARGLA